MDQRASVQLRSVHSSDGHRFKSNKFGVRVIRGVQYQPFGFKLEVQDEVRLTTWLVLLAIIAFAIVMFVMDNVLGRMATEEVFEVYTHGIASVIAGVFALLATILSLVQISGHLKHWVHPSSQTYVVRILAMVPIYAISAWLSLTFVHFSTYIDFVRGCYEAYVIYSFMLLLTEYLGGHRGVAQMMRTKPLQPWPFPMGCCCVRVRPDGKFLWWLKYGAMQYVIAQPILSVMAIGLATFDLYEDGDLRYDRGFLWVVVLQNVTQLVSLYALIWLYLLMRNELQPFRPVSKFIVVKSVVFFTFWQSVGLAVVVKAGGIKGSDKFSVGEVQVGVQDFLVCIEMFIAAAVHKYTFSHESYLDGSFLILMEQRKHGSLTSGAVGAVRLRKRRTSTSNAEGQAQAQAQGQGQGDGDDVKREPSPSSLSLDLEEADPELLEAEIDVDNQTVAVTVAMPQTHHRRLGSRYYDDSAPDILFSDDLLNELQSDVALDYDDEYVEPSYGFGFGYKPKGGSIMGGRGGSGAVGSDAYSEADMARDTLALNPVSDPDPAAEASALSLSMRVSSSSSPGARALGLSSSAPGADASLPALQLGPGLAVPAPQPPRSPPVTVLMPAPAPAFPAQAGPSHSESGSDAAAGSSLGSGSPGPGSGSGSDAAPVLSSSSVFTFSPQASNRSDSAPQLSPTDADSLP